MDVRKDVALHESFRPRHKYKVNGHQTRFFRSDTDNKDLPAKTPHCAVMYKDNEPVGILQVSKKFPCDTKKNKTPTSSIMPMKFLRIFILLLWVKQFSYIFICTQPVK